MRYKIPDEIVQEHIDMIKEKTGETVSWSEGYDSMYKLMTVVAMLYFPEELQEYMGIR